MLQCPHFAALDWRYDAMTLWHPSVAGNCRSLFMHDTFAFSQLSVRRTHPMSAPEAALGKPNMRVLTTPCLYLTIQLAHPS